MGIPRHFFVLLLALLLAGGCVRRDFSPPDTLVFAIGSNPANLDPRFASDSFSDKISGLIFDALVRRDVDGATQLHLAEKLENPDDLTWVLTLRPGITFSDGNPLTAADVVATYQSIRDPATGSVKRLIYDQVDNIEAPDPRTVVFHLKEPYAPFLENLTIGILPEAQVKVTPADARLIGSGPYRLVKYVKDQGVELEANPSTWQTKAQTPKLLFKIVPEATVRALELIHGSIDLTQNDLPVYLVDALREREGLAVETRGSLLVKYLAFNMEDPALVDLRVREAIACAIDVQEIITWRFRGMATPARSFLHPDTFAYEPDLPERPRDLARAAHLLDEAGYPDPDGEGPRTRLSLVYKTSLDETAVAVARIFSAQLKQVGIDLKVETAEWGVFMGDIKQGKFQLYSLSAVGINDPDYYTFLFGAKNVRPNGANRAAYRNPRLDTLLDDARKTLDRTRRAEIYGEVQKLAAADIPYLPLWYETNVVVHQRQVHGYQLSPGGEFFSLVKVVKER